MKRFIFFIILSLILSCKSTQNNTQLLSENKALNEQIIKLEYYDSLNIEAALEVKKMNVVYRGVPNPIYISMPNTKELIASGEGLTKVDDYGNYTMNAGLGNEVDITIKGITSNNDTILKKKTLRIKDIKAPIGTINDIGCGSKCELILKKEEMTNATIGAKVYGFLHNMDFRVIGFKIKMPHYRTIEITDNKMNERANDLFTLLIPNDSVIIFDIKVRIHGSSRYRLKGVVPIIIKIVE